MEQNTFSHYSNSYKLLHNFSLAKYFYGNCGTRYYELGSRDPSPQQKARKQELQIQFLRDLIPTLA